VLAASTDLLSRILLACQWLVRLYMFIPRLLGKTAKYANVRLLLEARKARLLILMLP
jgi:hypothetical protein